MAKPKPKALTSKDITSRMMLENLPEFVTREYPRYKSFHGPKYIYTPNYKGVTPQALMKFGINAGIFAGIGVGALLFYASGIPRIKKDIFSKIPIIGDYFVDKCHPQDNPL